MKLGGKDCDYQGAKICNGAVTKEIGTKLVKICSDGKIKTKTRKSVGEGFPLVGRDTGEGKGKCQNTMKDFDDEVALSFSLVSQTKICLNDII